MRQGWTRGGAMLIGLATLAVPATSAVAARAAVPPEIRALHERLLTLDSHLDTPANLVEPGFDIRARHHPVRDDSQVDLPRMEEGGLDGGFWAIYTPQGPLDAEHYRAARDVAVMRGVATREMVAANAHEFALATRSEDAARIAAEGRRIVYQSIENAYPLGEDVSLLSLFYDLGVRMVGITHFRNNQFGDSATDPDGPRWRGLSPAGVRLVAEANRLGMILDASHASDEVLDQLLKRSATPIILSHSGCKAVYDHPRNVDDERLRKLAATGGVIQINAYGGYLRKLEETPERTAALAELAKRYPNLEALTPEERARYQAERRALNVRFPAAQASFEDFMAHLLHALRLVGPDHVGIGLDWDGGGGVAGMEDVSALPRITAALVEAGYGEEELRKIWGGNVLRLLAAAEAKAERRGVR